MVKRHTPLQLALVSLGLLCYGAMPSYARPGQSSDLAVDVVAQPAAPPAEAANPVDRSGPGAAPEQIIPTDAALGPVAPTAAIATAGLTLSLESDRPSSLAAGGTLVTDSVSSTVIAPDLALAANAYLTTATALTSPSPPAAIADRLAQLEEDDSLPPEPELEDPELEDPELQDPELGVIQVRSLLEDNDLGILRIRDQPQLPVQAALPAAKIGFFSARLSVASSDNILLAVNDASELTGDTFLRPSIAFGVYPALGPQTAFIATADLGLQRYNAQSSLNYDDLRFRVGLRQGLSPRSYGQLIFTYQELYRPGGNRGRFFKNSSLGLTLGRRDSIAPSLALDSYYLLQYNGAQSTSGSMATDFSRILQSAGTYLGYDITPNIQAGISYQLNLIDYTTQDRYDTFQQVLGQVVYRLSPTLRLNLYGGISFGRSSEPRVQFNDTFFGAAIDATIPLF